jgi:hypothetical protein
MTNNEQWNAQLKKMLQSSENPAEYITDNRPHIDVTTDVKESLRRSDERRRIQLNPLEGVISNHCDVNQKDVELLEGPYKAAWEARKKQIESKEYKEKVFGWMCLK